jgi:hypothetical protein
MSALFSNLSAAAHLALAAIYQNLFANAIGLESHELADWYKMDPEELLLGDDHEGEVFAKRMTLPIWDMVDETEAAEIADQVMAEFESRYDNELFITSHNGDREFVVYLCNTPVEHDMLRIAFDDEEPVDEEEEEETETSDNLKPDTGRVLSMVPRIPSREPAPADTEADADFPAELDFPLEGELIGATTAESPAEASVEHEPIEDVAEVAESAPEPQEEAPAAISENDARVNALVDALVSKQADPAPAEPVGPKKEDPEVLAVIHDEKMQQVIDMLPSDTVSELKDGVLTIMYSRDVEGQSVDFIRTVTIENENFNNVRYVDIFYIKNESGHTINRATNPATAVSQLEHLQ